MQTLNRGMMDRYEIPDTRPDGVNAVQFGLGERLLGVADRLIDDARCGIGIAAVEAGEAGYASKLLAQDGMYTLLVRGERDEAPVRREQVVQCLTRIIDPAGDFDALDALAGDRALCLALVDIEAPGSALALGLAARLLAARFRAGLDGLDFVVLGEDRECASRARDAIERVAAEWLPGDAFPRWLNESNRFLPSLADSLAFRAEADEAARVCTDMNYADAMLHIAEPYAAWTIQAPEDFRTRWPLERAGVRFTDDLSRALRLKHRLFDAGLFAMAAPGWLMGLSTLRECMTHEALRAFVGRTFTEELLPALGEPREAVAPFVIEAFERYENPMNDNRILRASAPLLSRLRRGALSAMADWAVERFEPPPRLSFALAATVMLYAGARPRPDAPGVYDVARGRQSEPLPDDPTALEHFSSLAHDMPPETLAYAVLADRELWGRDLRDVDGLEARLALDLGFIQRLPGKLPEGL